MSRRTDVEIQEIKANPDSESAERTCRECGCTEFAACEGGCGWVVGEYDLCTACDLGNSQEFSGDMTEDDDAWWAQALANRLADHSCSECREVAEALAESLARKVTSREN